MTIDFYNMDAEILKLIPIFLPKIIIATVCGAIIGYDRELKNKSAGIRTNVLICIGCTLLTAISFYLATTMKGIDPTRIIGQIVTGIGFLGAGSIMKQDDKIVGITTASFIWVVSAIGILIGIGAVLTPIVLTIFILAISKILYRLEKILPKIKNRHS